MATYYVWSGATGTNAGTSWTNAYTAFGSAVTAATTAGDIIKVHKTHQDQIPADTTYTIGANISVITVDKDSSDALAEMGTGGWIGNGTTSYSVIFSGTDRDVYFYGVTFRVGGASTDHIQFTGTRNHYELENCYLWAGGATTSQIQLGSAINSNPNYIRFINTTFRFGSTSQSINLRAVRVDFEKCVISTAGSAPTTLLSELTQNASSPDIKFVGCDLSHITGTLVGVSSHAPRTYQFIQCKIGANVTILATQTTAPNKASNAAYVFDCSSGDTHGLFAYYDAFGSCVSDTGIYYTTGAAAQSWKIVTTANCSYYTPFTSPFVDFYNTGTTSITPYFEILRTESTSPYQNDEVWGEFFVKTTSGSTQSTEYSDRMALRGTPANQAAGTGIGSWTGAVSGDWSGKIDSGSAVTPAETGAIRGRIVVGEPNTRVWVDPQIRT